MIREWMAEAGPGLEMIFIQKMMDQSITSVDESDMWYGPLKKAFDKVDIFSPAISYPYLSLLRMGWQ